MKKSTKPLFNGAEIITSLIYLSAISAALMYVLCKSRALVCTIIMSIASFGVFMVFYKLRLKKLYSLLAFVGFFIVVDVICNAIAGGRSPSFMQFIFTSSDFFDPFYAAAAILLFSSIIGFTTAYFTAYLPRPCFLLLPAFIPLILGARTAGGLPAGLTIFMAVGFFAAMLGIARPEKPSENVYIDDKRSRRERLAAIGALTAAAAVLLTIFPRSSTTRYGMYLDNVFTRRNRNYYGAPSLGDLRSIARPNTGNNDPGTNVLFVARTAFPSNVASGSYDIYNGEEGWEWIDDDDTIMGYSNWERSQKNVDCNNIIEKLKRAAADGKLREYKSEIDRLTTGDNSSATMTINVVDGSNTAVVLHPQRTYNAQIKGSTKDTYRNRKDEIFTAAPFGRNASYTLQYYVGKPNESFIAMLENVDLEQLLSAAFDEEVITAEEYNSIMYQDDYARQYSELVDNSGVTPEIQALADEITSGLTNDYQKALAIEQWFGKEKFTYDLGFTPDEPTAEYFLFKSRRGICTDFATASALLLRAAGIPARYTEGYVLSGDSKDSYGRYLVTAAQAHAFATAYIGGYGWIEIDGTKYAERAMTEEQIRNALIILVVTAAVISALVIVFRKQLSELLFAVKLIFKSKNDRVRAVYFRTRKLACSISGGDPKTTTAEEVRDIISRALYVDTEISAITDAANELIYSGKNSSDADDMQLYRNYKTISRKKRSMKK